MIATLENETDVGLIYGNDGQVDFFLDHDNEFPAFVAGFGAGKTYVGCQKLLDLSLYNYQHTGSGEAFVYIAVEPNYPMVSRILYPTLLDRILKPLGIKYVDHSRDKLHPHIILPWKAEIWFYSGNKPHSIVGSECAGVYVDEAHLMPHLSWTHSLYRMRDARAPLRQAFATFTPQLPAWTHEWWGKEEIDGEPNPTGYKVYHASTRDNSLHLPPGYADMIAGECEEGMEISAVDGRFTTTRSGKVYHTYDPAINKSEQAKYDPMLPLGFSFDFNPGVVGVTVEVCQQSGQYFYFVDEINIKGYSLEETCGRILDIYGSRQKAAVTIYGDATGHRTTSLKSEYKIIKGIFKNGYSGGSSYTVPFSVPVNTDTPRANPSVANRCAAVRTLLCDSMGRRLLFVNPACKRLIRDFQRVVHEAYHKDQQGLVYKGNSWDICKCDGSVTHASDAAGYWISRVRPERNAFKRQVDYRIG